MIKSYFTFYVGWNVYIDRHPDSKAFSFVTKRGYCMLINLSIVMLRNMAWMYNCTSSDWSSGERQGLRMSIWDFVSSCRSLVFHGVDVSDTECKMTCLHRIAISGIIDDVAIDNSINVAFTIGQVWRWTHVFLPSHFSLNGETCSLLVSS